MVSPKSTGEPVAALIEKISILLQEERALLEDENPDWDRLEENLAEIGELFKLLPLNGAGPSGAGEAQLDPGLHKQLHELLAQRRKNEEILQAKARELGRQIASLKQEKTAVLAYIANEERASLLKGPV